MFAIMRLRILASCLSMNRHLFSVDPSWGALTLWRQTAQLIFDLFDRFHILLKVVDILLHVHQRTVEHIPENLRKHHRSKRGEALTELVIGRKVDPPTEAYSATSAHSHYNFSVAVRSVRPSRVSITRTRKRKPSPPLGRYPQPLLWDQIGSTPRNSTPNTTIRIVFILILPLFAHSPHTRYSAAIHSAVTPSSRPTVAHAPYV